MLSLQILGSKTSNSKKKKPKKKKNNNPKVKSPKSAKKNASRVQMLHDKPILPRDKIKLLTTTQGIYIMQTQNTKYI